jgi:putative membrane protein
MNERDKPSGAARFSTDFRVVAALVRTAFSSEQSLMSWIRTSLSLFTFGFSITQFFYHLDQRQPGAEFLSSPRRLGMSLVGLGILVLLLAMVEHVQRMRKMKKQGLPSEAGTILPIGSALGLLIIGIVALVGIILNWHL